MGLKCENCVLKLWITLSLFYELSLFASASPSTEFPRYKPKILAERETILQSGDNFTVLCLGNYPLFWKFPDNAETKNYSNWTKIQISDAISPDRSFRWASRLFIENITYPYVGFYECMEKKYETYDSIYLFVNDTEHLSVNDLEVENVMATQYQNAVIPCRPTTPDVNIELADLNGIKNAPYDPKTGFTLYISHLSDEGLYDCTFTRQDLEFIINFYVKVIPSTDSLAKPLIEKIGGKYTTVGQELVLNCSIRSHVHISIEWITPTGQPDLTRMKISQLNKPFSNSPYTYQTLTIPEAQLQDKGTYICNVTDNQNHHNSNSLNVTVFDLGDHFIRLTEENDVYSLSEIAGAQSVQWRIDVDGHPSPTLSWLDNKKETIPLGISAKYETSVALTEALLKIKDITIEDFGNYTLLAENEYETKSLTLFLNVTDKPSVYIESTNFHIVNKPQTIKCIAAAYPKPSLYWYFKKCETCFFEPVEENYSKAQGLQLISEVSITTNQSGFIKCAANNSIGYDETVQGFYVSDVENGLDIFGFDSTINLSEDKSLAVVAEGDGITLTCGASIYNYSSEIQWFYNEELLKPDEKHTLERSNTEYTNRVTLTIPEMEYGTGGIYTCQVPQISGNLVQKSIKIQVAEPRQPIINDTNLIGKIEMKLPNPLILYCNSWGVPKPQITWLKNKELLQENGRIKTQGSSKLIITETDVKDEGEYRCEASNRMGKVFKESSLRFTNKPSQEFNKWFILIIVVLLLAVILAVVFILIKIRNEKKLQRELQIAGLANFEKGALENLNPELGIDDQAELLPYDKKWEFPIEKLKLGKQLGSGAFGVVMKGTAKGILEEEAVTTVAVKMVKRNADHTFIKALASELKIMVHLGKHLNVVNLLGACTKNVAKRELLVIVEYCRFGNLLNYLYRHRDSYIDQVDPKTGHLDYGIGQDILERTYSGSSSKSNPHSPSYLNYAALAFKNETDPPADMIDYRGDNYNTGATTKTDTTLVSISPYPNGDDNHILSNSAQPEWRSNYRGDYNRGNIQPICTKDLLTWAFQVSRGMEYLASRKVMHGDLAARNILLADNNIVKICDFGLAKSVYKDNNYKKKGDGPLPVKWMAVESIRDRIFSTQSDVWSFGIVLWEFFSLAKTPYPGMEANEHLYNKLLDGYRMESPEFAPKEIYKMMLDCWQPKPTMRPTFCKLSERLGSMLEDSVRKHYIDLNDPYLKMNTQRKEEGENDYLAMVSSPNFENLSSPHNYVNDLPPHEDIPGYLCMKPTTIFSPRPEDEENSPIFDFNPTKLNKKDKAQVEGKGNELIPMLGGGNFESDGECSPNPNPISFSNPSYHLPPVLEKQGGKIEEDVKDILKCPNNYVNMPQNKSAIKEKTGNKVEKDNNGVHYVNSNIRDWTSINV